MRCACVEPEARIFRMDPSADLQPAWISLQSRFGFRIVTRSQHDYVAAFQLVVPVNGSIPCGRSVRYKIGPQSLGCAQSAADDLLYFSLVQIDAGTKHTAKLRGACESSSAKRKAQRQTAEKPTLVVTIATFIPIASS